MTNLDFLSGLPAVLGIGGYFAFYLARSRGNASPILKTIVEIIRHKGIALPGIDARLTAKQVFQLIQDKPELRRSLDTKDYALLESVMQRDERANLMAIVGLMLALLLSLAAYTYLQTGKPKIVSASLLSAPTARTSNFTANTIDDLKVEWVHSGENVPFTIRIINSNAPEFRVTKQIMSAEHTLRVSAMEARILWPKPTLDTKNQVRIEFSNDDGFKAFGPFEVEFALDLLYFLEGNKLTIASMDGQGTLVPHSFEARCVVWPLRAVAGQANPRSVVVRTSVGKAYDAFPVDMEPDPTSLKCVYIGSYPIDLVRYTNLHTK
jgi:hypothetical protein